MRGETSDGSPRNSTAQLHGGENFFHTRDGSAGKSFPVKLHFEASIIGIGHLDGRSVLARAAKYKIAKAEAIALAGGGAAKEESAGAVAEESAEFSSHAVRRKRAAVNVGGYHGDSLRLSRSEERLRDSKGIEQAEAGAPDIERAAIFADEQPGMKLRRERRIVVVRFAGGDDPVDLLRSAVRGAQRFLRGPRPK